MSLSPHSQSPRPDIVVEDPFETDPLLPRPHDPLENRRSYVYYGVAVVTILVSVPLLVLLIVSTVAHIRAIGSQCAVYEILSMSLGSIGPTSFDTQVTGSLTIDPDLIQKFWYKAAIKSALAILGLVTVIPQPGVKLFAKLLGSSLSFLYVADLNIPTVVVDLAPRASNQFNVTIEINPRVFNVSKLYGQIGLQRLKEGAPLDLMVVGRTTLKSRHIAINSGETTVTTTQTVSINTFMPEYALEHFSLLSSLDSIYVDGTVKVEGNLPVKMHIGPIRWDLLMHDCNQDLVEFGSWGSEHLWVEPLTPFTVRFSGSILEIPSELATECENGYSPFNLMIKNYTEHRPVSFAIRAIVDDTSDLPPWIGSLLNGMLMDVSLVLPSIDFQPQGVTVNTVKLTLLNADDNLFARSLVQVSGSLESVLGIGRSMLSFSGQISISATNNETLIIGKSQAGNILSLGTNDNTNHFELHLEDWDSVILQPSIAGSILSRQLNGLLSNTSYYADIILPDLGIKTNIFEISTHDIIFSDIMVRERSFPMQFARIGQGNELLSSFPPRGLHFGNLNMSVRELIYKSSSPGSVDMQCNIEIFNPSQYALDIPQQELISKFAIDGVQIGQATISGLSIPANCALSQSIDFSLMADALSGKTVFEQWLGKLVSTGVSTNIDEITFTATEDLAIRQLLNQVSLFNVTMPQIEFPHVKSHASNNNSGMPFVLRSIIHVLTSEIELTLLNPVSNSEVTVIVLSALAKVDDVVLGNLDQSEVITIPPGVHQSHRLPFSIDRGIGMDVLRRALNGDLPIDISAAVRVTIGEFEVDLHMCGVGIMCDIRV